MRGVHVSPCLILNAPLGSSPHARGPHSRIDELDEAVGIIPACAGSTVILTTDFWWTWDHPRMRGVHSGQADKEGELMGSSPHARGPQ